MGRGAAIQDMNDRVAAIGLSPAERQGILDLLFERKTHREAGHGSRWASMKRVQRARRRARLHGVEIPQPRRSREVRTLAEIAARAA